MWKKLASIAAMVSAAVTVSACQTSMYKPIICEPGTALKGGRCQKVPAFEKRTVTDVPKKKIVSKKPIAEGPGISTRPKQDVYGRPIAK